MPKLNTCIVLKDQAEEAAEFYAGLFGVSAINRVPDGRGGVMLCTLRLADQDVVILNGGGDELVSQRVSLQIHVDGQEEFDHFWFSLSEGGQESMNGWLVDRFGVWWGIVSVQQMRLVAEATPEVMGRLWRTLNSQGRVDIARLERIAAGEE